MDWLYVILTLTLATNSLVQSFSLIPTTTEEATVGYEYNYLSYPIYGPRPTKEATVEHEYNYYNYPNYGPRISPPFSNPGEIVEGLTVEEVVLAFGYGWNADNLLKSASIACDTLGSDLSALIERTGQPGIVGDVCKTFETSSVEEGCNGLWDLVTNGKEGSFSLVPGMRCRERSDDYYNYGYGYHFNLTDYVYTTFGEAEDFNVTDYTTFVEAEEEVLAMIGDFNPYDPCSETGNKKVNNIVFALMDWLGPSVYSNIYQREVDPYSVCGILRYLLSIDVIDYVTLVVTISSYPAADILESFQTVDICAISQIDFEGTIAIRVAKELLVEYSELKESEFCDFIAKPQTREAYLELGATIVVNAFHTLVVEETCNDVLTIIAPLDKEGIHVDITGFNLTIASERAMFCAKASQAYSPNSGYVPIPYKLPEGVELDDWRPFEIPGVFLPGLTFIDLLEIEGASYHADKVIDGMAIYCIVFEEFLSEVIEDDTFDVKGLCDALRSQNTAFIEDICLTALVPNSYSDDHPIGLRPLNPVPIGIYIARDLLGIADISQGEICPALDYSFNQLSLRHVIETSIDIFLAEATPSINGICENWEEAKCKWKPYCPLPERRERPTKVEATTFSPFYYRPYIPSPEEVATANAEFEEKFSILLSLVLTVVGFDNREELCEVVAENIDPLSGRSDRTTAGNLRSNILDIFTDIERCSNAVDIALSLLSERDLQDILSDGNTNPVYQLTGYQTSEDFCQAVADALEGGLAVSTQANAKLSGTYNIFAKVAVYVQRVARSL